MADEVRGRGSWGWWLLLVGSLPLVLSTLYLLVVMLVHSGGASAGDLAAALGPGVLVLIALLAALVTALHRLVRGYLGDLAVSFLWGALGLLGVLIAGAVLLG